MINLDLTHPSSWLIWSGLLSDVSKYFQTQNKSNSKLTLESNSYHACGLFRDGQEIHRGDFSLLTPTGKLLSIFCSKKANSNFYRWIKFRGIHWAMSKRNSGEYIEQWAKGFWLRKDLSQMSHVDAEVGQEQTMMTRLKMWPRVQKHAGLTCLQSSDGLHWSMWWWIPRTKKENEQMLPTWLGTALIACTETFC